MVQKRRRQSDQPPPSEEPVKEAPVSASPARESNHGNTPGDPDPVDNPLIYRFRKRLPMREPAGKRDIFVSRDSRFAALKARAIALLDDAPRPVTLHAMGAAIAYCCDLALAVHAECAGNVTLAVRTTTVDVHDDYEPLLEGYPPVTKTRSTSGVRISISRTAEYV